MRSPPGAGRPGSRASGARQRQSKCCFHRCPGGVTLGAWTRLEPQDLAFKCAWTAGRGSERVDQGVVGLGEATALVVPAIVEGTRRVSPELRELSVICALRAPQMRSRRAGG